MILNVVKVIGSGFVEYCGWLLYSEMVVLKISYVMWFVLWDWNILSGVFLKDIDIVYYWMLFGYLVMVFVIGFVISVVMLVIICNVCGSFGGELDEVVVFVMCIV